MIAGGGNIGLRLARAIERDYAIKIIEYDKRRCEILLDPPRPRRSYCTGTSTDEGLLAAEKRLRHGPLRRG